LEQLLGHTVKRPIEYDAVMELRDLSIENIYEGGFKTNTDYQHYQKQHNPKIN
jgi:hypothetical protein